MWPTEHRGGDISQMESIKDMKRDTEWRLNYVLVEIKDLDTMKWGCLFYLPKGAVLL